jgi:hypothetical protein
MMKRFIGYHFFHGAGKIAPANAYYRTQSAMSLYSDQETPSRRDFMLDLQNDPEGGPLESIFHELCLKYGPVSRTTKGISLSGPSYRAHQWELRDEQVAEALSLLETVHREIPASRDRAHLQAFWKFKFVEPETRTLLPDQESMPEIDVRLGPGSSLSITTGKKTWVNAWFLFPFDSSSSPEFEHYVCRFQKELIFKFSPKHWRLWNFYPVRGWWPKKFVPNWYEGSESS